MTLALRYAYLFGNHLALCICVFEALFLLGLLGFGCVIFRRQHPFDRQAAGSVIAIELEGRIACHPVTTDRIGLRVESIAEVGIIARKRVIFTGRGLFEHKS